MNLECEHDRLLIFDATAQLIAGPFCSSSYGMLRVLETKSSSIFVGFKSDWLPTWRGFEMKISMVKKVPLKPTTPKPMNPFTRIMLESSTSTPLSTTDLNRSSRLNATESINKKSQFASTPSKWSMAQQSTSTSRALSGGLYFKIFTFEIVVECLTFDGKKY